MQFNTQNKRPYKSPNARILLGIAFFAALSISTIVNQKTAHAGLVSFVSSVFGSQNVSASIKSPASSVNSQTIALLQAAVNQDPNPEKSADLVPVAGGNTLVADISSANSTSSDYLNGSISIYVVRSGDTLSQIAKMFGVSVNTIVWANDVSRSTSLKEGQTLVILPVSGVNYTVKKGDTINGIVSKYKADLDEVLQYNDLSIKSSLAVGQTIIIPDAEMAAGSAQGSSVSTKKIKVGPEPLLDGWDWPSYPGFYIRPIANAYKSQDLHGHNAIDLAAPVGTPIKASASGKVIIAKIGGWNGGYGSFVVIAHSNGTQTLYAHLLRSAVSIGETISQGETVGYIGMTGLTTGPHLHFEIRGAKNPF